MRATEMVGFRSGKLVVTSRAPKGNGGQALWNCLCDCGNTSIVHGSNLRMGKTKSCGCDIAKANKKRLQTHGGSKTHDLYGIWSGIRRRCLRPLHTAFPRYGGRGITMAPQWLDDFARFATDVGPRPSKKHSLDRIDNDGNYEPGNVRWATAKEQADNRGPLGTLRAENAALIAEVLSLRTQLGAREAVIAEALDVVRESDQGDSFEPLFDILSTSDSSALDRVKAEAAARALEEVANKALFDTVGMKSAVQIMGWLRDRARQIREGNEA